MLATFFYNPQESRQIQNDLIQTGEALSRDQETPDFYSATVQRHDELGEVIGAFRLMYRRIADAINNRKKAEIACRKALSRLKPIPGCLPMNRK
jgi:phosphoserine phosphatase RsbU/P